jgi:hypothetical protein
MILLFDILSDYVVSLVGWYRVMRLGWGNNEGDEEGNAQ